MPLVGNKHFAYTPEGMKKAVAHAEKTGQKVKIDKKGIGGMVKKYSQGGMLKGPSHKKGGIPAVVKGSGQPIEMEGGEYVIKKSSADKLGPDILNYINKTGSVPKMETGGQVAKRTAGHAEKKMSRAALAHKSLASKGIDNEAMFNMVNPIGGTTKVAKAIKKAGGLGPYFAKEAQKRISRAIKTGQIHKLSAADTQLLKRNLKESLGKKGTVSISTPKKKMSNGGYSDKLDLKVDIPDDIKRKSAAQERQKLLELEQAKSNPYLKDFFSATEKTKDALDASAVTPEEYARLKSQRTHKTATGFNAFDTGQSRWRDYNRKRWMARSYQKNAAKRAREKAKARTGVSEFAGSSGLAARGAMKARGDQKAAARFVNDMSLNPGGYHTESFRTNFDEGGRVNPYLNIGPVLTNYSGDQDFMKRVQSKAWRDKKKSLSPLDTSGANMFSIMKALADQKALKRKG